ncbi:DnaJ-domain-containing protein [Parathielavia appendiculata]|uniref:DnaJ-domain-containing protein n=1 Tax=Parathielavia appendiculata TaxID=2587402 RepID=A0AAN6UAG1_9PEZI|nr:DnaJ-domain-containing protein [Parathielavia appendiculata]
MTTSLPPDPWKALGVERNADKSEIRSAYKKLVLKCHPDKVQDPTLKALKADEFQKVQQAYELLNDDAEKAKYEQRLKLQELQRAAKVQQDVKTSPNTSVPRSSSKYTYDIHTTASATYKASPSGGKVYATYTTTQSRSHEDMPSSRSYALYDDTDRQARRTASYEKPSKRDEDRRDRDRDERRRRKEEEDLRLREKERDREREKEKAERREEERREARKAEKKRLEKERERDRERDRRREADEKSRRHTPYVEHYDPYLDELVLEDEKYVSSKSEKKRSSSRKHDETRERPRERERERDRDREREKSSSRRAKSPHVNSDRKHVDLYQTAAMYVATAGSSLPSEAGAFWKSQTPHAPTPPPALDFEEEESIRRSSARAAGRRTSNDAARSREKLNKYDIPEAAPTARPIPTLSKFDPPPVPESPPRLNRSQTARYESSRPIPSLSRNQTWGPSINLAGDYYPDFDSEEERERRRRRSRRTRSPSAQPTHRYKVEGTKTSKLEPQYSYGESPTSARRYQTVDASHSPSTTYPGVPFRVKETKAYGLGDVSYAEYGQPYYSTHAGEGYTVGA